MSDGISEVNFVLGNRCNSQCKHCFSQSTPTSIERLDREIALSYASQLSEMPSITNVQFNGGEPFLYLKLMAEIINVINSRVKKTIKVATGAAEFKSLDLTRRMLDIIPHVSELWVSIDLYHLNKCPIENYKNIDEAAFERGISIVYSISFATIKELAETLALIKKHGLRYRKIAKQPVFKYGNAESLSNVTQCFSDIIPKQFRCGEIDLATIWPDGKITNCSAFAGRTGNTPKYNNLNDFFQGNKDDSYFKLRRTCSMSEIANQLNIKGPFNTTSACSTCKNILERSSLSKFKVG